MTTAATGQAAASIAPDVTGRHPQPATGQTRHARGTVDVGHRGSALRLGVAREGRLYFANDIARGAEAAGRELGWTVTDVDTGEEEAACDAILAIGSPLLYPDLVRRRKRARRVLWYAEPLPRAQPGVSRVHQWIPTGKVLDVMSAALPFVVRSARFRRARENAAIVREPANNLARLRASAHAFDRLVVDANRAAAARGSGLPVAVVARLYHKAYAGPLARADEGDRAIDLLFVGRYISRFSRRREWLEENVPSMRQAGLRLEIVTDNLFGEARRARLEQTRAVLDLHRIPGNMSWHRFIVATAAGAAVVTEPIPAPAPATPGVHYVEAPLSEIRDAALELLRDEQRRRDIVVAAQLLLRTELSMSRRLGEVMGSVV